MNIRTGIGFDVHRLEPGRKFVLGGVEITHDKGCVAHSDGDVLLHAICDALLGAAALGDIGTHFPDNDSKYKDIDSRLLLRDVNKLISDKGYKISNIDCIVALQEPKIKEYIQAIQSEIARTIEADKESISIKATTTEKLGFTGRGEGVAAWASVLLLKE